MKTRSKLAWLGALGLILVLPPVASSLGRDVQSAALSSDQKQNKRIDALSKRLSNHATQLRGLRPLVGVVRGYIVTDSDRMEAIVGSTITTGHGTASATVPFVAKGGEQLTLRGAIRSARVKGTATAGIIGGAGGALIGVCAPMGGNTCGGGTVSAGETVCEIKSGYNDSTGTLTLVDIRKAYAFDNHSVPKPSDVNVSGATNCVLPAGSGRYNLEITGFILTGEIESNG